MSIAIGKNQKVFIVPETSSSSNLVDRIIAPSAGITDEGVMHMMRTAGEGSVNQEREKLPDKRLRGTRSKKADLPARYNPGTYSLPAYVTTRVNGAGNQMAPEVDVLLKSLFGNRDNIDNPSTVAQVQYSLADSLPTFNIWFQKDHTVFCCVGATANQCDIDANGSDFGMLSFSGEFMRMFRGGTATLHTALSSGTATTTVVLESGHAARFDAGMYISIGGQVDDSGTTGTGYQIASIDYSTDTLTLEGTGITPQADIAAGAVVKGFIPNSNHSDYENYADPDPIHGKRGLLTIDDGTTTRNLTVLTCKLSINNNVKYSTDEKNGSFYATDFFTSEFREIKGDLTLYFREEDAKFWKDALDNAKYSLSLPIGDETGKIYEFVMPDIRFNSPSISGENEVQLSTSFTVGMNTTSNDELTLTLK